MYGHRAEPAWHTPPETVDFYDLKGVVEQLLEGLSVRDAGFSGQELPSYFRYGAAVQAGDEVAGWLGELLSAVPERLDLPGSLFVFLLNFEILCRRAEVFPVYKPLPRYPAVFRDVALVVPENIPAVQVSQALYRHGFPWLEEVRLFDVYEGQPIPAGRRSLAYHLTYRDRERTLTDEAVDRHHDKMIQALSQELGAELR